MAPRRVAAVRPGEPADRPRQRRHDHRLRSRGREHRTAECAGDDPADQRTGCQSAGHERQLVGNQLADGENRKHVGGSGRGHEGQTRLLNRRPGLRRPRRYGERSHRAQAGRDAGTIASSRSMPEYSPAACGSEPDSAVGENRGSSSGPRRRASSPWLKNAGVARRRARCSAGKARQPRKPNVFAGGATLRAWMHRPSTGPERGSRVGAPNAARLSASGCYRGSSNTARWDLSLAWSAATSTSCTARLPSIAIFAATPAAWPRIMYCGSMRRVE